MGAHGRQAEHGSQHRQIVWAHRVGLPIGVFESHHTRGCHERAEDDQAASRAVGQTRRGTDGDWSFAGSGPGRQNTRVTLRGNESSHRKGGRGLAYVSEAEGTRGNPREDQVACGNARCRRRCERRIHDSCRTRGRWYSRQGGYAGSQLLRLRDLQVPLPHAAPAGARNAVLQPQRDPDPVLLLQEHNDGRTADLFRVCVRVFVRGGVRRLHAKHLQPVLDRTPHPPLLCVRPSCQRRRAPGIPATLPQWPPW
mmetsp:Transcript_21160/g.41054  ORF Transcript_21160/g.41054 Transcript_21160/m.41054 type:complete len:253 (+) Transcript_21160:2387-3145(+)